MKRLVLLIAVAGHGELAGDLLIRPGAIVVDLMKPNL